MSHESKINIRLVRRYLNGTDGHDFALCKTTSSSISNHSLLPYKAIVTWTNCCLLACLLWLTSCGTTKNLQEGEVFLQENRVKIIGADKAEKKKKLESGLLGMVQQKPNTRFFGISRRWFYYKKKKRGKLIDPKKPGKRTIYEEPAIFDTLLVQETKKAMSYYLNERGYFQPQINHTSEVINRQIIVTYQVAPNTQITIDTALFISPDTGVQEVLNTISSETLLKKGMPVSNQLYEEEKKRITNNLRNRGYREFYLNYIDQLVTNTDTTTNSEVILSLTVFPRGDGAPHQIYTVDNIVVYPFYLPTIAEGLLQDTLIDGVQFFYPPGEQFAIKPEVILKRIALKQGAVYSQENFNKTVRNLGGLGIFKFANINDKLSQDSSNQIDFTIYLPANKKYVLGADVELRNTFFNENSPIRGNFLGGAINFSYRNKNLFKGSEDLRFNFQIGGEFGRTNSEERQFFRTFDINPRLELNIPKFSDPLYFTRFLNRVGLFSNNFYNSLLENATTRISVGLNWSQRRNFLGFFSGDLALGYTIQNNANKQYFVNQVGISFFDPTVGEAGREILEVNPFLERSFNSKQLFTGIIFRDFGMILNKRRPGSIDTWRLKLDFELSGAEVFLANTFFNAVRGGTRDTFQLFNLDYSQFVRLEVDASYYKPITNRQIMAFRVNAAIAPPYGFSSEVPYVKQYYAGGPTSVRAWKIRELGPGGYQDPSTFPVYEQNSTPFYQTGNFKFIFSAEYRFKMFKVYSFDLEGALFLDGGNIWTLKEDPDRPKAELTWQFYKQIALGTGVGFRMDFEYFKLALDLGYRVRNPYPNPEGNYWAYQRWRELKWKGINYNLSVGYPF